MTTLDCAYALIIKYPAKSILKPLLNPKRSTQLLLLIFSYKLPALLLFFHSFFTLLLVIRYFRHSIDII